MKSVIRASRGVGVGTREGKGRIKGEPEMSADSEEHRPGTGALGPPHLHVRFAMQRRTEPAILLGRLLSHSSSCFHELLVIRTWRGSRGDGNLVTAA